MNASRPDRHLEDVRSRYRQEREKRLRADGSDQYLQPEGEFARYDDDPYVAPGFERAPLEDEVTVAIVGGGFGGILLGARLFDAGIEDVRVIEKGGDFGGTWYWNRYPGAACDIESYVYLPLLEELGYMPSERYTHAPEIFAYCRALGERFGLYRNACFQTEVTELRWDDDLARWIISTDRGDRMRARFVALAIGNYQRPKLPGIPGIESFEGRIFHTSRWDYGYTGGDSTGGMTGLADKRVGIIGTGATAIQCVPHLGEDAGELYVFQRTPAAVAPRDFTPTDEEWFASLEPGWHRRRVENFSAQLANGYDEEDLVGDGWTEISRRVARLVREKKAAGLTPDELEEALEAADVARMDELRAFVDEVIEDEETAELLKPWYSFYCKRPTFHDRYLHAFNRPNVHLVDTDGRGVERITPAGAVVAGSEYPLDCLVLATGFEFFTPYTRRAGFDVIGRDGVSLAAEWAVEARTFHGLHVSGFPNLFIVSGPQGPATANQTHALDEQAVHLTAIVRKCLGEGILAVEATPEAEAAWVEHCRSAMAAWSKKVDTCTPGYLNNEGKASERSLLNMHGPDSLGFFEVARAWRERGDLEGLLIRTGMPTLAG